MLWLSRFRVATNSNPYQGLKPEAVGANPGDYNVATNSNPYQGLKPACGAIANRFPSGCN